MCATEYIIRQQNHFKCFFSRSDSNIVFKRFALCTISLSQFILFFNIEFFSLSSFAVQIWQSYKWWCCISGCIYLPLGQSPTEYKKCSYFQDALWTVVHLTFSLVQLSPLPCVNKYTVYLYTVCKGRGGGGGVWGYGTKTEKKLPQIYFKGQFF